jgi:16S rRNA (guanine1207-N2)-methyltransferase
MQKSLTLPSQLLIYAHENIKGKDILIIGGNEKEVEIALEQNPASITFFNFDYSDQRTLADQGIPEENNIFGDWYQPKVKHDSIIIYLPKSDALINMTLGMVNSFAMPGTYIYLVGEKNSGIKSQLKNLEKYIGPIEFKDSARHSTLYLSKLSIPKISKDTLEKWIEEYHAEIKEVPLDLISLPGVFSHGRLDEGTRMLLETITVPTDAKILDWGCGSGAIGLFIKKSEPSNSITLADSNALAIAATKMTFDLNQLTTENIQVTNVFSDIKEKYDLIISNPPFHKGVKTNYASVENFISQAKNHLNPGGKLIVVANIFLRYRPLLENSFQNCKLLKESKSYKIYQSVK